MVFFSEKESKWKNHLNFNSMFRIQYVVVGAMEPVEEPTHVMLFEKEKVLIILKYLIHFNKLNK